ncbi:Aste57867_3302 [Aphanomyces stellatus]|uniref:Aste57867_3302 protein n=1 Tax=Aphanomyces stellatus TaxID=120398 RepID=A0A485KEV9_9STRA|nr:hypothetical protein As57867_003292 [Aphanomyces stellatus]VFT80472.1 Aste57867_3302 [Aphanomyces stellatus]
MHYRHDASLFNLAGYAICTARGSAQVVLFNGFLLLWPVMTRLHYLVSKHTPLARLFLLQHRVLFHITYGLMSYVAGWVHKPDLWPRRAEDFYGVLQPHPAQSH